MIKRAYGLLAARRPGRQLVVAAVALLSVVAIQSASGSTAVLFDEASARAEASRLPGKQRNRAAVAVPVGHGSHQRHSRAGDGNR